MGDLSSYTPSVLDMQAVAAQLAPMLIADVDPVGESTAATIGDPTKAQPAGHRHPRLTSATYGTLDANSVTSVPFTRLFANKPAVVFIEDASDAPNTQPAVFRVQSWVRETMTPTPSGAYTGCVVKGWRSQVLPTQSQLSLASLLTGVITGINALASSLTGYNVFGATASGASFSAIALARSDV